MASPATSDPYDRTRALGGRLKLKTTALHSTERNKSRKRNAHSSHSVTQDLQPEGAATTPTVEPEPFLGKGRIVSSGKLLQGFETAFVEEAQTGDMIIVDHPRTLQPEKRVVIGILSQRSLTLNDPFSSDLVSTTSYYLRKDSIKLREEAERKVKKQRSEADAANSDFVGGTAVAATDDSEIKLVQDEISRRLQNKIKKARNTVAVRKKTGMWGYKTVTEQTDQDLTAEERLDIRRKQGRDKYCW